MISLQTLLGRALVVGGRTALELQGYAHYLSQEIKGVHLYGAKPPSGWLEKLPPDIRFVYHHSRKRFHNDPITRGLTSVSWNRKREEGRSNGPIHGSWLIQPLGPIGR